MKSDEAEPHRVRIVDGHVRPSREGVCELYLRAFSPPPLCEGPREAELFAPSTTAASAKTGLSWQQAVAAGGS